MRRDPLEASVEQERSATPPHERDPDTGTILNQALNTCDNQIALAERNRMARELEEHKAATRRLHSRIEELERNQSTAAPSAPAPTTSTNAQQYQLTPGSVNSSGQVSFQEPKESELKARQNKDAVPTAPTRSDIVPAAL